MEMEIPGFSEITYDPARMNGQPCIRGTRLTVRRVLSIIADYPDRSEIAKEFPELRDEHVRQALSFAASRIEDHVAELPTNL